MSKNLQQELGCCVASFPLPLTASAMLCHYCDFFSKNEIIDAAQAAQQPHYKSRKTVGNTQNKKDLHETLGIHENARTTF
mmetsp:Transcript_35751/g.61913  ORF Transcript_35751/g.61913 Transcript_35751/m.61913 type:complete len:80 (-) Transcript_35751:1134-1373(-)